MIKAYMNWSGGKDSSLCLHRIKQDKRYSVESLLTSVNAAHNRISMHGVRRELLVEQANAIELPLHTIELSEQPGMAEYEQAMMERVGTLKAAGYTHAVFGDIFLEDLRIYREQKLASMGMECVFPLWKVSTKELMEEFLGLGFKAVIVCVNEKFLDKGFCGRLIDESFVRDLPDNVDVCGENGEYHSFVFDGPIFKYPIPYTSGEIVYKRYEAPQTTASSDNRMDQASTFGFYFCDLLLP
ncbi:diphthine--ammonia ligase [Paraflavitalea sp. CAU 1676]|uniref:Dph6-related ATP pyrophosphatase n=1 Tax=Paraflavitalea sp. CAU 1676 TaxID=3032598 RepID=UPI0023DBADC6|nr:diphthine--ammonia ligase [Paraflavitalea sp. CAU 1676]MDF2187190.1 diphthine--ammonia ligase [Paraflavitalea sp. CAU 1676]